MVKWWDIRLKWKYSKLRFYYLNGLWNYRFWLNAKPIYKQHKYIVEDGIDFERTLSDAVMKSQIKKKQMTQRRFVGLLFENRIYQDNPGLQGVDSATWDAWINKGLVKL